MKASRSNTLVAIDLPRGVGAVQRVVLAAASHVVVCVRSLPGLRDTIRLQSLVREQAPQARLSHTRKPELAQLVECRMGQQRHSPQW